MMYSAKLVFDSNNQSQFNLHHQPPLNVFHFWFGFTFMPASTWKHKIYLQFNNIVIIYFFAANACYISIISLNNV